MPEAKKLKIVLGMTVLDMDKGCDNLFCALGMVYDNCDRTTLQTAWEVVLKHSPELVEAARPLMETFKTLGDAAEGDSDVLKAAKAVIAQGVPVNLEPEDSEGFRNRKDKHKDED